MYYVIDSMMFLKYNNLVYLFIPQIRSSASIAGTSPSPMLTRLILNIF